MLVYLGVPIEDSDGSGRSKRSVVEVCQPDSDVGIRLQERDSEGGDSSLVRRSGPANPTGPGPRGSANSANILTFFWTYYPTPVSNAPRTVAWITNAGLNMTNTTKVPFKDAVDNFERDIAHRSIPDLHHLLTIGTPLFGCVGTDFHDRYEKRGLSFKLLMDFLLHQFDDQYAVSDFVHFLYRLLDRKSGKKNCLYLIGPPSSGKTYFTRMIKEALITSGQMLNMNRNSNFPFNNCINKRVLLWDEPSFDPSAIETLKTLFSGDETVANRKYADFEIITRTPVIVTANMNVFPRDDAFDCRIERIRFKQAPMLMNRKYLHPMSLYDLFVYFEILSI